MASDSGKFISIAGNGFTGTCTAEITRSGDEKGVVYAIPEYWIRGNFMWGSAGITGGGNPCYHYREGGTTRNGRQ